MVSASIYIGEQPNSADFRLLPGQNLYTGVTKFVEEFGDVDSIENDLLNIAAGIYAADLCVLREARENFIRNIDISIEVINIHRLKAMSRNIERALHTVSKDNWVIKFVAKNGAPVTTLEWNDKQGAVLLFSGGIDSMCAASEFLNESRDLILVSHNSPGNGAVDKCQKEVLAALEGHHKKKVRHVQFRVFGRNHGGHTFLADDARENTQRTRSFLFLTLAALTTRRAGFNKVLFMAENGQFAIHLPLNQARVGPFSTHTADPEFVLQMQALFRSVLDNEHFEISNPFNYKTKAEVFALLPLELQKQANLSASCWMISRTQDAKHCGYCVPCISRRIAIEFNGLKFNEYETDIFRTDVTKLSETKDQRRNLVDYLEFILKFRSVTDSNTTNILAKFPELYNPAIDSGEAIKLYKRVSEQSFKVLSRYPKVMKLIG